MILSNSGIPALLLVLIGADKSHGQRLGQCEHLRVRSLGSRVSICKLYFVGVILDWDYIYIYILM